MNQIYGLQSGIRANRFRSIMLIILFPALLFVIIYIIFFSMSYHDIHNWDISGMIALEHTKNVFFILGPILAIWMVIGFLLHRSIIFGFAGAKPITRKENPEIYNIVENLCISRGLPTPKIGILKDSSMNAFATGRSPKNARIVFSEGLIQRLNKREIEAVAAHELTHIMNKDSLMMIIIVVFVGAVATLGEIGMRSAARSGGGGKKDGRAMLVIFLISLGLIILGYLVFPLIRLALSRKREYLADAGSVELTKDKHAMISALKKISTDSTIESIKKSTVAAMCIESPFGDKEKKPGLWKRLTSTHPSIQERIEVLNKY